MDIDVKKKRFVLYKTFAEEGLIVSPQESQSWGRNYLMYEPFRHIPKYLPPTKKDYAIAARYGYLYAISDDT